MVNGINFRQTWLWRQAFETPRSDCAVEEQEFFRTQYMSLRDRAAQLVSRIAADMPGMTIHDISHSDALWDTASLVAEGAVNVNPAEAFVLGASILLHDAAMSLAAFPGGLEEIKNTLAWRDAAACHALASEESGAVDSDFTINPEKITQYILPNVLRQLHAERAEQLAEQAWKSSDGSMSYLIEDSDLRHFYGPTIGQISHSHWWSVHKLEQELSSELGALANRTHNKIDKLKLACLLRVADALHLDSRRAPRFLRTLTKPTGVSELHWLFQERLARPHIELDAVVFTAGQPFGVEEADAWWLAFDTLNAVDRELRDVDVLLQGRGSEVLRARRVKGAGSPDILARSILTRGWRPVNARLQASDIPRIVENLGGEKLYGNEPTVPLRELLQNASDAIQARRKYQNRPSDWGLIQVSLQSEGEKTWLVVEDNGIGMSEQVLTGPLLDFGTSFWRSSLAMEEFPGLMASGLQAIGRFGIGFFSIFMLGSAVRVYSRRCDRGQDTGRLLEFSDGPRMRPIISPATIEPTPIDGGTRVEVLLKINPYEEGGLLYSKPVSQTISLTRLVGAVAPNIDVAIAITEADGTGSIFKPKDWLEIADNDLVYRLNPLFEQERVFSKSDHGLMRPIVGKDGQIYGRAFISPTQWFQPGNGWITISGLRAGKLKNMQGILSGQALTAVRDRAMPLVSQPDLANWASEQAILIAESVKDEERQAHSAEVVLECGGNIGNLKIVKWAGTWLDESEFLERIQSMDELAICFDSEFYYDEDEDEVHPREFRDHFEENGDVALVFKHEGDILKLGSNSWPRLLTGQPSPSESNLAVHCRKLIQQAWGNSFWESEEDMPVGSVQQVDIIRSVSVFHKDDE